MKHKFTIWYVNYEIPSGTKEWADTFIEYELNEETIRSLWYELLLVNVPEKEAKRLVSDSDLPTMFPNAKPREWIEAFIKQKENGS